MRPNVDESELERQRQLNEARESLRKSFSKPFREMPTFDNLGDENVFNVKDPEDRAYWRDKKKREITEDAKGLLPQGQKKAQGGLVDASVKVATEQAKNYDPLRMMGPGYDPETGFNLDGKSQHNLAAQARKQYQQGRGKGMPSAGSFSYLSADLRPLAGGKYFPRGWEEKMKAALDSGKIDQEKYDKAMNQYNKWLHTATGATIQANRMGDDAVMEQGLGNARADAGMAAAQSRALQEQYQALEQIENNTEEWKGIEEQARLETQARLDAVTEARKKLADMDMNIFGTGAQKAVGALAIGLSGIGNAIAGRDPSENMALKILNQRIQQRIQQKELEYKKNMGNLRGAQNEFGMAMAATKDARAARMMLHSQMLENTQRFVENKMALAGSEATREKLGILANGFKQQRDVQEQQMYAQFLQQEEQRKMLLARARAGAIARKKQATKDQMMSPLGKFVAEKNMTGHVPIKLLDPDGGGARTFLLPKSDMAQASQRGISTTIQAIKELNFLESQIEKYGVGDAIGFDQDLKQVVSRIAGLDKESANLGAQVTQVERADFLPTDRLMGLFSVTGGSPFDKFDAKQVVADTKAAFQRRLQGMNDVVASQASYAAEQGLGVDNEGNTTTGFYIQEHGLQPQARQQRLERSSANMVVPQAGLSAQYR